MHLMIRKYSMEQILSTGAIAVGIIFAGVAYMMAEQLVHLPFIEKNVNIEQSFANLQFVVWASALFLSIGSIAMVFATGRSYGTCKTCGSRVSSDKLIESSPSLHSS